MLSLVQSGSLLTAGSLPVVATSLLLMAAIGSAILALLVHREGRRPDLIQLHREIDHRRGLVQQGSLDDGEIARHQARLRELQRSLPKDDLRRH